MRIVSLQAENVKKLVAVEITPTGNVVEITGKNGSGKTSVLDSIWWALTGAKHIQAAPIRKGQKTATIRLKLAGEQELVVTRKFAAKAEGGFTTSIEVATTDGAKFGSPQTMLDALLGELAFDPLEFARSKPVEQFEALKRFVPGFDFATCEIEDRNDFDRRALLNKQAKQARAVAESMGIPPGAPDQPVDLTELEAELEAAGKHNADIEQRKANRGGVSVQIEAKAKRVTEIEREIGELNARVRKLKTASDELVQEAKELEKKLAEAGPLPEPVDTTAIRARMEEARRLNEQVQRVRRREQQLEEADGIELEANKITSRMKARQAQKRAAIAAAKMPVEGIDFGEGIVLLNGQPFEQASDAEQLRASVAIAMAGNPKLRVIRIRDGSLLDSNSMKLLGDMATADDFQVWIETVDSSGKQAVVLEDGRVKAQPSVAA